MIYIVQLIGGHYDDKWEDIIFATTNRATAMNWCNRYNRIVNNHKERIRRMYSEAKDPYMYEFIVWDEPTARYTKTETR